MPNKTQLSPLVQHLARINELVEEVPALVKQARLNGATWEQIGSVLGVTKQRAHQLYAHKMGYEFPMDSDS